MGDSSKIRERQRGVHRRDGNKPITIRTINRVPLFAISVKSLAVNYSGVSRVWSASPSLIIRVTWLCIMDPFADVRFSNTPHGPCRKQRRKAYVDLFVFVVAILYPRIFYKILRMRFRRGRSLLIGEEDAQDLMFDRRVNVANGETRRSDVRRFHVSRVYIRWSVKCGFVRHSRELIYICG